MSEDRNHIDQDLFAQWQQENSTISQQQLTIKEMETILKKASSGFSNSIRKTLIMDMIFKGVMIIGFMAIILLYLDNTFSLITSIVFIGIAAASLFLENNIREGLRKMERVNEKLKESLTEQISFYRSNMFKYPLLMAISYAMFYVLGSMIYHALTYGYIKPFHDAIDVFVLGGFMVIGLVVSLSANLPYFKSRINNLESLMKDIGNEDNFYAREEELRTRDQYRNFVFGIFIVLGIIALLYLIFTL